jgi:hypothetical protein
MAIIMSLCNAKYCYKQPGTTTTTTAIDSPMAAEWDKAT